MESVHPACSGKGPVANRGRVMGCREKTSTDMFCKRPCSHRRARRCWSHGLSLRGSDREGREEGRKRRADCEALHRQRRRAPGGGAADLTAGQGQTSTSWRDHLPGRGAGQVDTPMQGHRTESSSHTMHESDPKVDKNLSMRANVGRKHRHWVWSWLLPRDTKNKEQKKNVDTLDFIKMKNFCASKHTTKEAKKQQPEQEKVFVNHFSGKRLVSRTHEEFLQLGNNREKTKENKLMQKPAKHLNQSFSKEDIQTANEHGKRCWTPVSSAIRETGTGTRKKHHFVLPRQE